MEVVLVEVVPVAEELPKAPPAILRASNRLVAEVARKHLLLLLPLAEVGVRCPQSSNSSNIINTSMVTRVVVITNTATTTMASQAATKCLVVCVARRWPSVVARRNS